MESNGNWIPSPLKARWLETDCIWLSRVLPFELRDSRQSASKWVILMDPAYINGLFVYPGAAVKRTPTWYFHLYTEPTCSLHIAQFKLPPLLQPRTMNASVCIVKVFQTESKTRHRPLWDFFSLHILKSCSQMCGRYPKLRQEQRYSAFNINSHIH